MFIKKLSAAVVAATIAVGLCSATPSASATAANPTGKYQAVAPTRIVDTRIGLGLPSKLSAYTTTEFTVAGKGGVPATGVQSVVVNITVVNPSRTGYLVAYAGGTAKPGTSTVNYPAGWTGATGATVPVGTDGKVRLYAGGADVEVAVDVMGWYATSASTAAPGSLYLGNPPERWFDSRTAGGRLTPGDFVELPIEFNEEGGRRLTAMQFNLTATGGFGPGWFTAWDGTGDPPSTSALNFTVGETSPNLITVPVRRVGAGSQANTGKYLATIENTSGASAHLIVDAVGSFYTDPANFGTTHVPVTPTRVGDTRLGIGLPRGTVGAGRTVNLTVPTTLDNPRVDSFEGVLTMAGPTASSYLTMYALGMPSRPATSNVNADPGRNRSNGFAALPGCSGTACNAGYSIYNAGGNVHVIVDVTGRFELTDEAIAAVGAPPAKRAPNAAPRAVADRTPKLAATPTVRR